MSVANVIHAQSGSQLSQISAAKTQRGICMSGRSVATEQAAEKSGKHNLGKKIKFDDQRRMMAVRRHASLTRRSMRAHSEGSKNTEKQIHRETAAAAVRGAMNTSQAAKSR